MKTVSRKEMMIIDIEYFILSKNVKFKRLKNTFDFELFTKCIEIENRYCVFFKNLEEAEVVLSSFNQDDYKSNVSESYIKDKVFGMLYESKTLNKDSSFWLSFFVQ